MVKTEESRSMGDPDTLTDFINFAHDKYSAKEYALILWNHGAGPINGVCIDELYDGDMLTVAELDSAIDHSTLSSTRFAWIGFDACLMGNVETAAKLRNHAKYMIASQETEPANGWNYAFLRGIENDASGAETAQRIIDLYFEANAEYKSVITMACIELNSDKMKEVTEAINNLFTPLGYGLDEESYAHAASSRYEVTSFGDMARGSGEGSYDIVDLRGLAEQYLDTDP